METGQYSLRPTFAEVPAGRQPAHAKADRQTCLDFIEAQGTDMRPKSLIAAMDSD